MLVLVMSLLDGSFVPLLSFPFMFFCTECPEVMMTDWLSGGIGLSHLKFGRVLGA